MAGAIVYWRANERRRSREFAEGIDDAVAQGREAAGAVPAGSEADAPPFDQR
ncbi:MAG: hypothetical protein ACRENL_02320 [Candidatus Dormibacteria bacterium]